MLCQERDVKKEFYRTKLNMTFGLLGDRHIKHLIINMWGCAYESSSFEPLLEYVYVSFQQ